MQILEVPSAQRLESNMYQYCMCYIFTISLLWVWNKHRNPVQSLEILWEVILWVLHCAPVHSSKNKIKQYPSCSRSCKSLPEKLGLPSGSWCSTGKQCNPDIPQTWQVLSKAIKSKTVSPIFKLTAAELCPISFLWYSYKCTSIENSKTYASQEDWENPLKLQLIFLLCCTLMYLMALVCI